MISLLTNNTYGIWVVNAYMFNSRTWETKLCKSLSLRQIWSTERIPSQPGLNSLNKSNLDSYKTKIIAKITNQQLT